MTQPSSSPLSTPVTQEPMSELVFACLQDAVTLAKSEQIHRLEALQSRLGQHGYDKDTIGKALFFWGQYEQQKTIPGYLVS
jgi:hypothetical protein